MTDDRPTDRQLSARVFRLGDEPRDDISADTSIAERLAMMWPLALEAWTLSGQPLPSYQRRDMPIRVRPLGQTSAREH